MKNRTFKKMAAAVMAVALIGSGISAPAADKALFGSVLTANADELDEIIKEKIFYDEESHTLTLIGLSSYDDWSAYKKKVKSVQFRNKVYHIVTQNVSFPVDSCGLFSGYNWLYTLDVSSADTSRVKDMSLLFNGLSYLDTLDVSNFDTSNVTNMDRMFAECRGLENLDVSSFNTSKVTNMNQMFSNCQKLKSLDLSNFDTLNVTDMFGMFEMFFGCESLEKLDISNFDTSNVTNMCGMFNGLYNLESLDVSKFDTSNVTIMARMFQGCRKIKELDVSNFNTSNVTDMNSMFAGCQNLKSLDLRNFNTSNVTKMDGMFFGDSSLESLDVSSFDTSNVVWMSQLFNRCSSLKALDLSNFDTTSVLYIGDMLKDCPKLEPDISTIVGKSVTLDGTIGANFFIEPCKNLAKVVLSGPNGDITYTDFSKVAQENGTYKFTYPINATQANEKVTLKTYDEDGRQLIVCKARYELSNHSQGEGSVQGYIDDIKKEKVYKEDPVTTIMVNTLENYCKAAENYFKGTKNTVNKVSEQFAVILDNYAPTIASGTDIKLSLILDSETAVRIYTNGSGVKIDGQAVTPYMSKYGKCYEIANIPAHQLINTHTLTVDGMEYTFSPMSYVYRVMNSESTDKLREAAWAVFLYATAADEYNKK
ncbi:MAG: BspA family leucine-rich repeat surface protein [Ruminococcus sp.]|uniref:BspA family leucine-rich repeat surface protein n=1 Tax=Ruminococcus sp. TaxID=41978 RepID=UPI0025D62A5B|nr:BspA family leucine-rich repeat surface protein [Ruminococcus sp.]MBR5683495.1 BspA family leucine-rich repeat surface protein [Ruminococcus sp.]